MANLASFSTLHQRLCKAPFIRYWIVLIWYTTLYGVQYYHTVRRQKINSNKSCLSQYKVCSLCVKEQIGHRIVLNLNNANTWRKLQTIWLKLNIIISLHWPCKSSTNIVRYFIYLNNWCLLGSWGIFETSV